MTGDLPWLLMLMSLLCLVGLGISGLLVSQAQERRQKFTRRFEETVAPYRKAKTIDILAYRPAPAKSTDIGCVAAAWSSATSSVWVYAGWSRSLFRSTDGGTSWTELTFTSVPGESNYGPALSVSAAASSRRSACCR